MVIICVGINIISIRNVQLLMWSDYNRSSHSVLFVVFFSYRQAETLANKKTSQVDCLTVRHTKSNSYPLSLSLSHFVLILPIHLFLSRFHKTIILLWLQVNI